MNMAYFFFFRFYLIPPTPFNKNKMKMAVQEMHGEVDGNAEGLNAHAQKTIKGGGDGKEGNV